MFHFWRLPWPVPTVLQLRLLCACGCAAWHLKDQFGERSERVETQQVGRNSPSVSFNGKVAAAYIKQIGCCKHSTEPVLFLRSTAKFPTYFSWLVVWQYIYILTGRQFDILLQMLCTYTIIYTCVVHTLIQYTFISYIHIYLYIYRFECNSCTWLKIFWISIGVLFLPAGLTGTLQSPWPGVLYIPSRPIRHVAHDESHAMGGGHGSHGSAATQVLQPHLT